MRTAIAKYSTVNLFSLKMINEYYAIGLRITTTNDYEWVLFDFYHEEEKKIRLEHATFPFVKETYRCSIEVINIDHILLVEMPHNTQVFHIHLIHLDLNQLECEVKDSYTIQGIYREVVFDSGNRDKFAVRYSGNQPTMLSISIQTVFVKNGRFEFNPDVQNFDLSLNLFGVIMSGDKMKAIVCDGRNEIETVLGLYELDLSSNGGDGVVRKLGNIEKDEGMVRVYFMNCWYFLLHNQCFLSRRITTGEYGSEKVSIYQYDMTTQRIQPTGMSSLGTCWDLFIDKNDVLTICTKEGGSEYLIVHRKELRKVDTLANLCWFSIRRYSMFDGKKLYERTQLPNKMQMLEI